jgi:transposase InsO family protein
MVDRSSRPRRSPRQIAVSVTAEIETLRRQRLTGKQIAGRLGISKATVHRVLNRRKLNCLSSIDPPQPVQRYEHDSAGSLLHLDIKKLGCIGRVGHRIHGDRRSRVRGAGWEFVHVAIDDHTRVAFCRIFSDERHPSAVAFLLAAVDYYRALGTRIKSILTDNGSCYRSKAFRKLCTGLGVRHRFTRPYRPRTNGKAERFIQTLLREWAYAAAYENSLQRTAHLPPWLHHYNWHRPHGSLEHRPPVSRLGLDRHNLLRLHS